jgi:antitoxin (DNA-binding transcriptional repressor) of toxin-antitoxin stability system
LPRRSCDATMSHMRKATVRDLRYHFRDIEAHLNKGEEIELYKRQKMIGRLLPVRPKDAAYPDFSALRRRIFGTRKARKTGTDLVSEERGAY